MVRGKGKVKHKHILINGKAVDPSHLNQFFASISTDPDYSLDDVIDFLVTFHRTHLRQILRFIATRLSQFCVNLKTLHLDVIIYQPVV